MGVLWPDWWNYDLVLSPHAIERMQDRDLAEVDLRTMLEDATGYHEAAISGRFCIETSLGIEPWEIVIEPDEVERIVVVVTAYRVE